MRSLSIVIALVLGLVPLRSPAACDAPVYHQFDFWVGTWRVTDAHGTLLGRDIVSKRLGGCVIYEEYHDVNDPSVGIGMTGYDRGRARWHQDFMDDAGFVLALDGALQNGAMILEGTDYVSGKPRLDRGTWSRHGEVVEELWEISADGGATWKTHFDGWFHPASVTIPSRNALRSIRHVAGARVEQARGSRNGLSRSREQHRPVLARL
jgi:hypothetical protein